MMSRDRRLGRSAHRSAAIRAGRAVAACLTGVALTAAAMVLVAPGASAAPSPPPSETSDSIRWTVKPADSERADGRVRVEASLDPGEIVQEYMAVKNLGDLDTTFVLSAADGLFNQNGRFDMLPADEESVDAGTWIELPDTVTVPAGKTTVVPFTITVPRDATPGDHEAGVAASVLSETGDLRVVSRVGFRVAINVNGEVVPGLDLVVIEATYHTSWNPFSTGTVEIRYSLSNDGNVRLEGNGQATASGPFGWFPASSRYDTDDVAPGQSRQGVVVVEGVWPGVWNNAELALSPHTVEGVSPVSQPQLERGIGFWAVPWPQLALLVLCALAVVGMRRRGRLAHRPDDHAAVASGEPDVSGPLAAVGSTTTEAPHDED